MTHSDWSNLVTHTAWFVRLVTFLQFTPRDVLQGICRLSFHKSYIHTYLHTLACKRNRRRGGPVLWITYRELCPGSDPAGVIVLCSWARHFALIIACFHLTGTLRTKRGERAILQSLLCRLIAQCFTPPRSVSLIPVN